MGCGRIGRVATAHGMSHTADQSSKVVRNETCPNRAFVASSSDQTFHDDGGVVLQFDCLLTHVIDLGHHGGESRLIEVEFERETKDVFQRGPPAEFPFGAFGLGEEALERFDATVSRGVSGVEKCRYAVPTPSPAERARPFIDRPCSPCASAPRLV